MPWTTSAAATKAGVLPVLGAQGRAPAVDQRDGPAQTGAAAGDQRSLALESHGEFPGLGEVVAGDVDVDVKIESMEANDRITLVGQVLSNAAKFFDNTPVKLESHGIVRYRTRTNVVGEFSFDEVPKDTYHLSVDLPEGQITLFCVHRGNS